MGGEGVFKKKNPCVRTALEQREEHKAPSWKNYGSVQLLPSVSRVISASIPVQGRQLGFLSFAAGLSSP